MKTKHDARERGSRQAGSDMTVNETPVVQVPRPLQDVVKVRKSSRAQKSYERFE